MLFFSKKRFARISLETIKLRYFNQVSNYFSFSDEQKETWKKKKAHKEPSVQKCSFLTVITRNLVTYNWEQTDVYYYSCIHMFTFWNNNVCEGKNVRELLSKGEIDEIGEIDDRIFFEPICKIFCATRSWIIFFSKKINYSFLRNILG